MAKIEFEEKHVIRILDEACHWFKIRGRNQDSESFSVYQTYAKVIGDLFQIGQFELGELIARIIKVASRENWGKILLEHFKSQRDGER